jgi:hypothetical protein
MMHGRGKSDSAVVAVKPANKAEPPTAEPSVVMTAAAEPVERRAGTKGNADWQSTHQTQRWAGVSQALERIRQAFAVRTRGRSRMRESCTYGSARGVPSNGHPYRNLHLRGKPAAACWQGVAPCDVSGFAACGGCSLGDRSLHMSRKRVTKQASGFSSNLADRRGNWQIRPNVR